MIVSRRQIARILAMEKRLALLIGGILLVPGTVFAYVGPGAGLSLLGALWALLVAIGAAIIFVIAWPIRKMRRRKREEQAERARQQDAKKADSREPGARERAPHRPEEEKGSVAAPQPSVVRQEGADRSRRQ
jgi:type VI protein secretion system component VasK